MNWLVRNVKVSLAEPITYGDVLAISTEVIGWRHVWARRHTEVRRADPESGRGGGGVVATVDTDWVLLTRRGHAGEGAPGDRSSYFSPGRQFKRDRIVLPEPSGVVTTLDHPGPAPRRGPAAAHEQRRLRGHGRRRPERDLPAEQRLEAPELLPHRLRRPALPGTPIRDRLLASQREAGRLSHQHGAGGIELTKALVSHSND